MTTPLWCLVVVAFIPYVLAGVRGYFIIQQLGTLDNKHPRNQALELTGAGARANAAQANAWESTAVFTIVVGLAHALGADPDSSATAASIFVGARIAHAVAYVANLDLLRTGVFLVGMGCCIWLIVLAASA